MSDSRVLMSIYIPSATADIGVTESDDLWSELNYLKHLLQEGKVRIIRDDMANPSGITFTILEK